MLSLLVTLTTNVLIILSLVFIFGLLVERLDSRSPLAHGLLIGLLFGVFSVFNMAQAVYVEPGIIVDMRGPFMLAAGVFGGWPGALVGAGLGALYRGLGIGGIGTLPGIGALVTNASVGALLYKRRVPWWMWIGLGVVSVGISVLWGGVLLPPESGRLFIGQFAPAALILYPLTALAIGSVMTWQQKQAQLGIDLRRSEARFRALFNQNYQFVGLLRPDGTVIEINDSALSYAGVEAADVVGQPFWETLWWAYDPAEREKLKGAIRQAAQGRTITYQTHAAGAGGRTLPIDFTLKPVIDADGSVIMLIPEGHDRSGEATVEALTHFIEDSAHHLRSPLTVIKTSLYLGAAANQLADEAVVRARDALPADACEQVRPELEQAAGHISQVNRRLMHIQQAADNLHSLIESTLSLSHLDQDTPVHATVDLRALVHKETTQFTPVAAERRIQLDVHVPDEPVLVAGQADQLRLVVQNLVENAVRYTPEAGRIGVSLTTVDHTAMLRVWDSGIGIPQEDLTRIFTRFYRSQNGKDFTQRGTGLGLAIVKKTVELHKGRIEVESKVGEGSAFTITLPVVSPPRTG